MWSSFINWRNLEYDVRSLLVVVRSSVLISKCSAYLSRDIKNIICGALIVSWQSPGAAVQYDVRIFDTSKNELSSVFDYEASLRKRVDFLRE